MFMNKVKIILISIFFFSLASFGQNITIGDQEWTAKNLTVEKFKNGDPIQQVKTNEAWLQAGKDKQPAWCYYKNDPANGTKYGKLYNWYAVNDPRGLAPEGYHIPTDSEWFELIKYLGGEYAAGKKIKSVSGWKNNGNGTNECKFAGLPGGNRNQYGEFEGLGAYAGWWTTNSWASDSAKGRNLNDYGTDLNGCFPNMANGMSIRCIKD
jgi:uncharacterized protein (TIGR02145 family)